MGVNIEQIVAILLQEGRLGAFDLNDKKYGDDDLMVGSYRSLSVVPYLPRAGEAANTLIRAVSVALMLDQCHNIEAKMPAVIGR